MAVLSALAKQIAIYLIRIYQCVFSPILGHRCRFDVTCSQYGIDAIHKFGILKGSWKTGLRILRCHPLTVSNKKDFYFFKHVTIKDVLNMDSQRNFFIIAFLIMSFILWQSWESDYPNSINFRPTVHPDHDIDLYNHEVPKNINENSVNQHIINNNHFITVKTDIFLLKINLYGGNIEEAYLLKYLKNLGSKNPFHLLHTEKNFVYQIHSGLINESESKNIDQTKRLFYTDCLTQNKYVMSDHENELRFTLIHHDNNNIVYMKHYVFNRNDYAIHIYHTVKNMSIHPVFIRLFGDLVQTVDSAHSHNYCDHEDKFPLYSYRGAAYSTDKNRYQKYSFKDMQHTNLKIQTSNGWIAMLQKYFVTAWLPKIPNNKTFYTSYINNKDIAIGFKSDSTCIPVGKTIELQSILWMGPKIQENMKLVDKNLDLVIDYGWLWFISEPLFKLLQFIYNYIGNWGMSIILITLIIRLIMYPLTKAQYTSMAKIRMLQPKLSMIQDTYKYDKYQYHQKTIELYKSEKVNPLGGCLPLLIQMPIFLALYYILSGSVELRHAKFALWINDLSSQDPYYILPIIMGITMFFIQKLSPTTITDPIQKKIMTIMLMVFTVFFLWFPSGLVLYYIASNVITIVQQQIIYHGLSKKGLSNKTYIN